MFGLGVTEIIIIVVILGLLFFGSQKITDLARSAGRFSGDFKRSKLEIEKEINEAKENFKEIEKEIK